MHQSCAERLEGCLLGCLRIIKQGERQAINWRVILFNQCFSQHWQVSLPTLQHPFKIRGEFGYRDKHIDNQVFSEQVNMSSGIR